MRLISASPKRPASGLRLILVAALTCSICACGSDGEGDEPASVLVLSAFPGELRPLVERAAITETAVVDGHQLRIGSLGGKRVILALTGIGLANATMTTRALLDRLDVSAVVVSAVAGSTQRVGDVVVPLTWTLRDGAFHAADQRWIELAEQVAGSNIALEHCAAAQPDITHEPTCLPFQPAIVVGGVGESQDLTPTIPRPCQPGGGDVLGCDLDDGLASNFRSGDRGISGGAAEDGTPIAVDMETAAIAREAAARGVPFIAFRGVSDGEGDPLGLPGFPLQFIVYYRLAAHNAAAATIAFLERVHVP
jgi:nucleoside phosphorylase